LAHFRQALAINPESEQAKVEIEHVLEQKEKHLWAFAEGAIESGDREQACKYLRKVLEINPKSGKAWLELGELTSDPQEALGYLEHALIINPASERARVAIRQINEEQEAERLRARQELEQARAKEELERLGHLVYMSDESAKPSRKVASKWGVLRVGRIALMGIVLVCGLLIVWFTTAHETVMPVPTATPTSQPKATAVRPTPTMTYRQAIERAQRATVGIGIARDRGCFHLGSGAVVDPTGLIITNLHVVEGGNLYCITRAEYLEGETYWYYNARVAKRDTLMDLALLRVESHSDDGSPVSNLSLVSVPLGDSNKVHTGDTIYICGYPKVGGQNVTVTKGLVSGFEESRTLIKTDAEFSPGSSGGVAITENGLLIGIPTLLDVAPWGSGKIGYLIAVNEVRRFLQSYQGQ